MNILLLDHPQHTHGTWLLYYGLVRVLGRKSVTVFPPKPPFWSKESVTDIRIMDYKWYRDVYTDILDGKPLPQGIPPLSKGEYLTTADTRPGCGYFAINYLNVLRDFSGHIPQELTLEEEVIELINKDHYDIIVLGNSHRVPTIALARLRDRCKRLPPIVYFDAGERDEFNSHWWHVFHPQIVFKNILTPEIVAQQGSPRVPCEMYPMPLSHSTVLSDKSGRFDFTDTSFKDRPIDLISKFGPTWPARHAVQQRIEQTCSHLSLSMSRPFSAILTGYDMNQLFDTKVSVTMRGSGRDTERYWDIPAMGAAMICDGTMGCIHPYPFVDKQNAVFYRNLNELDSAIKYLFEDDERRIMIAKNGQNHLRRFHSTEARALFFLGIVQQKLNISYTEGQQVRLQKLYESLQWNSSLPEWHGAVASYD